MIKIRVRIRFRKEGDLRLISHRDLLRTMERMFRRANLQLSMSQGFHPKPKMSFPLALALGVLGADEVMELELAEEVDSKELANRLTMHAPPGLVINDVQVLPPGSKKARVRRVTLEMPIPAVDCPQLEAAIEALRCETSHPIERGKGKRSFDLRPQIDQITLVEGTLRASLWITEGGNVRPEELLKALNVEDLPGQGVFFTRTAVQLHPEIESQETA